MRFCSAQPSQFVGVRGMFCMWWGRGEVMCYACQIAPDRVGLVAALIASETAWRDVAMTKKYDENGSMRVISVKICHLTGRNPPLSISPNFVLSVQCDFLLNCPDVMRFPFLLHFHLNPKRCHDANFVITGGTGGISSATSDDKVGIMIIQFLVLVWSVMTMLASWQLQSLVLQVIIKLASWKDSQFSVLCVGVDWAVMWQLWSYNDVSFIPVPWDTAWQLCP